MADKPKKAVRKTTASVTRPKPEKATTSKPTSSKPDPGSCGC